mgnify:CR=1 FL=1
MNSLEKAILFYCTAVSFFCIVILIGFLRLQKDIETLNKNQETLQKEIEEVDNFNILMWEDQIEINRILLGIPNETY